jgi:two-component system LytT family response regulator
MVQGQLMKMRTLIVDDEPLARARLRQLLSTQAEVEVIGECSDGLEAVATATEQRPDLIFLDIKMPELDGFGVLDAIRREPMPLIVFVTAYDQFALRAFEVHAVDYLLKPYDRERFETALNRALSRWRQQAPTDNTQRLDSLLSDVKPRLPKPDRLVVKSDGRVLFLRLADIDWLEAADNYVRIHVGTDTHMVRETMATIEARLPAEKFMRISRSSIVSLERVKELQPLFHGDYAVILRNGVRLTLSRSYRDRVEQLLSR